MFRKLNKPYAAAGGMLLHINGKFKMRNLKSSLFVLSQIIVLNRPSLPTGRVSGITVMRLIIKILES